MTSETEKQPSTMKIDINEETKATTTMPSEDKQTLAHSESSNEVAVEVISNMKKQQHQQPKEPETKEMAKFKKDTVRRIKHLFLLFVRQFDVHEFEIMVRFLRVLLEKHKHEPLKMFGKLVKSPHF